MPNRLAQESSPYLQQHAENPVDWYPWGAEALALARQTERPILLSIGYSACHWCHVMAHESFEDAEIASAMNEHFVCIKVDREERPDLDKVYQLAHHLLTRQTGGWPLTVFLDPDTLIPFFAGTYFPKTPRFQLPGFNDLLLRITQVFTERRSELTEQGQRVQAVLSNLDESDIPNEVSEQDDRALLTEAREQLGQQYDPTEGGFGQAPKFPMPSTLERLLRHWAAASREGNGDREALDMVLTTLTKMARGGIYDHLGGGFCRYSVDRTWMIPHFEKMLYDNGQLLSLYADAVAITSDELFSGALTETADWLLREMRHPKGGFFAALDADSEGEEGKFYVWRRDRVKKLLTEEEYLVIETLYGLDKSANFEGRWHLHRRDAWRSVVDRLSLDRDVADAALASAKHKLFTERSKRVRPGLDDKVLTAWNALALKGLTQAGMRLGQSRWIDAASDCASFLRAEVWRDGMLYASWKEDVARFPGYLDDYANLLNALMVLLEASWQDDHAAFAVDLADGLLSRFFDEGKGGFFFTAHDQESLIHRPKPTMEEALPPGNGIACQALSAAGHLFGDSRYLDAVAQTLSWARGTMTQYPAGHTSLLAALESELIGPEQIIIRGPEADLPTWLEAIPAAYNPWRRCYAIAYQGNRVLPAYLPKLVSLDQQQRTVAYRCQGMSCSLPIESPEALRAALRGQPS